MNVLISSAAAKRSLIEGFRSALQALNLSGKVIAADSDSEVPAARFADGFVQQPPDEDSDYADRWLSICREYQVDMLVPTRDAELIALSRLQPQLRASGVTVLTSPPEALATCLDKLAFYQFCVEHHFPVASRVNNPGIQDLPLFARHRTGAGSRSCFPIRTEADLDRIDEQVLVQPFCDWPEFSIDALFSLTGEPLQAIVRERVEVVNGESVVTRICDIPVLSNLAMELGAALGLTGHAVIQCFFDEREEPLLIECNPRFGGASMVSVAAGLASCERLLQELSGSRDQAFAHREIVGYGLVDRRNSPGGAAQ